MASGVVTGWIWYAELDELTCEACVSEHGSIHDLEETLDGHYNCRCAALPYIEGLTGDIASGQSWFDGLDEDTQKAMMGNAKHEHYKNDSFQFSELSIQKVNDVKTKK